MTSVEVAVVPLSGSHNRSKFDCGSVDLNTYLASQASQGEKKGLARTFVAVPVDGVEHTDVLAYYSLSAGEIGQCEAGEVFPKRLPRNVPVVRLSRLAIDVRYQRQGLGRLMLMNALQRAYEVSLSVGSTAVFVDAKDEAAREFYLAMGFTQTPQALKLYVLMSDLSKHFGPEQGSP